MSTCEQTRPPPGFEMSYQFYANIKVVVTLPRPQLAAILQLKNFETDLPMYSHLIDNLASTVYFRTISLRGCNTPIRVEVHACTSTLFNHQLTSS